MTAQDPAGSDFNPIRTCEIGSCPICGSHGRTAHPSLADRNYGVPGRWQIVRCSQCHSGWLNPAPIPADIARCYVGGYYTHDAPPPPGMGTSKLAAFLRGAVLSVHKGYRHLLPGHPLAPAIGRLATMIPSLRRRATFNMDGLLIPFRPGGRLLEIGCGGGSYLTVMRMLGWSVFGIDPDPVAAKVAAAAADCPVHVGTVEDAPFDPASFDAVVSNHTIEHVYDPKSFVQSAGRLLAAGGLMAVQTPNFDSLGHKLFGDDLFSLDPPRHLCLFTPASLRRLFEDCGLFHKVRIATPTATCRSAVHRRNAVRQTGNFLGQIELGGSARLAELLLPALEACGNKVFRWGEEIRCTAVRRDSR